MKDDSHCDVKQPDMRARAIGIIALLLGKTVWVGGVPLGRPRPPIRGVSGSTSSTAL